MKPESALRAASFASAIALLLLVAAVAIASETAGLASQERFEYFQDAALYTANLREAAERLRQALFVDNLFILAYIAALSFTALGFSDNNPPAALFAGLGVAVVASLDIWENVVLSGSIDLAANGLSVAADRIGLQAAVSAAKWHAAAISSIALTFVLPQERILEILLVWAARLAIPVATALFVTDAWGLRAAGAQATRGAMLSGFVLLMIVTHRRSRIVWR